MQETFAEEVPHILPQLLTILDSTVDPTGKVPIGSMLMKVCPRPCGGEKKFPTCGKFVEDDKLRTNLVDALWEDATRLRVLDPRILEVVYMMAGISLFWVAAVKCFAC
eukprot:Nitzschia sp. Nitz4//scaffold22_size323478//271971//272291//NITZ4_000578-RA/size323478-exonerate_est2genome-gene-0.349-mRNA-1//-1//CDS//3329543148//7076//frame0